MGDGADMALDQCLQHEEDRSLYRAGMMSDVEAYDDGIIDELGREILSGRYVSKVCRCCKTGGLHWEEHKGKWRLFDERGLHECPAVPLKD